MQIINDKLIDDEFCDLKDVIYLNTSMTSVPPKCVREAYLGYFEEAIHTYNADILEKSWRIVEDARKEVAMLAGAQADEIAFVKNTAEGIGILANGYPLKSGDKVIVSGIEHASNLFAWINQQSKGIELHILPGQEGKTLAEDFIAAADGRTKVIAVSAVQFSSGYYTDLEKLGKFCHQRGIILAVDGIQAVGRRDIDVKRMYIDYLACGANKGLLSPFGCGFVYCGKHIIEEIAPPYASYQSVETDAINPMFTEDFSSLHWHKDARRLESGNLNYGGIAAMGAGAGLLNRLGMAEIENHILGLERRLRKDIAGLPLEIGQLAEKERSGNIFIYCPPEKEEKVKEILKKHRIYATVRNGYIRFSIGLYNTAADMEKVAEAFEESKWI